VEKITVDDYIEMIKDLAIVCIGGAVLTLIIGYFVNLIVFSCVMPCLVTYFTSVKVYFNDLSYEKTILFYQYAYEACLVFSFVPAVMIASRFSSGRKENFTRNSDGLWSWKLGMVYHLKKYWEIDIGMVFTFSIMFLIISFINDMTSPFALFYRFAGKPLGVVLGIFYILITYLISIIYVQNHWSAEYYLEN